MTKQRAVDYKTVFAWKQTPFGRIRKVPRFEGERWQNHRSPSQSPLRRGWSMDEVDRMIDLFDAGLGYDAVAEKLGRSPVSVRVKAKRARCVMLRRVTVLSASDVAALIGKRCNKTVTWWITAGWLPATAATSGSKYIWRIRYDDLLMFLHNPDYWMAWDATRITDADLRAEMLALRATGPRWLTCGEIARRLHVGHAAVNDWIHQGLLPARRYGNWYVQEADLDGFVIPSARSRSGIPKWAKRLVVGKDQVIAGERAGQ